MHAAGYFMSNIAHILSNYFGEKFIFEIKGDQIKLSQIKMCFLHISAPDLLTDMEKEILTIRDGLKF